MLFILKTCKFSHMWFSPLYFWIELDEFTPKVWDFPHQWFYLSKLQIEPNFFIVLHLGRVWNFAQLWFHLFNLTITLRVREYSYLLFLLLKLRIEFVLLGNRNLAITFGYIIPWNKFCYPETNISLIYL